MDQTTLDLEKMRSSAGQACRLMKVLSNPDRLLLLCQLSQEEKRVGELQETLGIVQPTLSQLCQRFGKLGNHCRATERRWDYTAFFRNQGAGNG